jgi:hypothetical protein
VYKGAWGTAATAVVFAGPNHGIADTAATSCTHKARERLILMVVVVDNKEINEGEVVRSWPTSSAFQLVPRRRNKGRGKIRVRRALWNTGKVSALVLILAFPDYPIGETFTTWLSHHWTNPARVI